MLTALSRFYDKVEFEPNTGCWLWTGAQQEKGYGFFGLNGKSRIAHRASYELHVGPVPAGMVLDHKCRVRGCVNPGHLRVVTTFENLMADGSLSFPRLNADKTHCPRGHEYVAYRPYGRRECHTCRNARKREKRREDCRSGWMK